MSTSIHDRCVLPPSYFRHPEDEMSDACMMPHADDRPHPADDAKKADGRHDIGTEDGIHEIGLPAYLAEELPEKIARHAVEEGDFPDVDDTIQRRVLAGVTDEEF